ncbi:MAG TPA: ATP-binding protein [Anaerolineae bacterium]|jgi:anti-sigma regulatory factor (Ser/Thr protein kinase)
MVSKNQITVSGHFKNLAKIGAFIERAARQAGLDDQAVYAVQMAVDEACSNIIEHGYGGEGRGSIRLTCQIQKDGLQVMIHDQARPFDPSQVPRLDIGAPLSKRQPRGMGLFFIRRLVDTVEFEFDPTHGNRLTLFKRREQAS